MSDLSIFIETIWGDKEGYVYCPNKRIVEGSEDIWTKIFFKWPAQKENIIEYILVSDAKGLEVFCAPAVFKAPKATKDAVEGASVLWADFDGNAPSEWPTGRQGGPEGAIPPPTLRVQSSRDGHEHVYWKLDSFCDNVIEIEDRNRSIAYLLRTDVSGWDCNQILRPPDTINHKRNLPVTLRNIAESKYSLQDFKAIPRATVLIDNSIDVSNLPAVERIIAKYPWDDQHFSLFMATVDEGQRSNALMRLGYFCAETGMSDTEMYAIIDNAASRWKKFTGRNDRRTRLLDIVNRARLKHPVGNAELTFRGLLGGADIVQSPTSIHTLTSFLDSDIQVEWAIEGLLEKGGFGLVAAMPGVGKTQFSIQLGLHAALGIPFLGWDIPKPQKILLLSLEMSSVSLKYILTTIAKGYTKAELTEIDNNFLIASIGEAISLDRVEGIKYLDLILDTYKPDGIIVDSMGKLTNKELGNEAVVRTLNNRYIEIRKKYGCWIWFIHHNRKESGDNKKPTQLADIYGSQYISAEMTSCLILWKEKETDSKGNKLLSCIPVKQRLSRERKPFLIERSSELRFFVKETLNSEEFIANLDRLKNDTESPFSFE